MKKKKVKTYLDTLMDDKGFRGRFAHEYEKLEALATKEKGKEKRVTKKFINNLKKPPKFAHLLKKRVKEDKELLKRLSGS